VLLHVYFLPALKADAGNAQHNPQVNDGDNHEHDERVAESPVFEPAPLAQLAVFINGKEVDISDIPVLQLAGMAMVVAVDAGPVSVRNGAEERANEANDIIHFALLEEGVMATIMLNDEDADQEKGIDGTKGQG